ncbi:MAG: hypothetical protein HY231_10530 [Acidobacteria bacterium]|nr:hypothetical protein [Acidobacteriota bacterium]
MKIKFRFILMTAITLFVVSQSALAQEQTAATQIEEMKKVQFLQGEWRGEGWIMLGANRRETFTQTEVVQSKLDGVTLLIEGMGKSKDSSGRVVHHALAVVSYDPLKKGFRFSAYQATGVAVEAEAKISKDLLEWGFIQQGRTVRFTIQRNDKGEWHEVGMINPDGKNWYKFFEMTLQRVK